METPPWLNDNYHPKAPTSRHHHIYVGTKFYMSLGGDFQTVAPGRDNLQISAELDAGGKGLHISLVSLWKEESCGQVLHAIRMQNTRLWSPDNLDLCSSPCGKNQKTKSQGRKGVGQEDQTLPVDSILWTCSLLVHMNTEPVPNSRYSAKADWSIWSLWYFLGH